MTDHATTPEPAPTEGHGPSIHDLVVQDVLARKAFGLRKYGVLLRIGDGRRHLVDAYQEALDLAVYMRQELARQGIDPRASWAGVRRETLDIALLLFAYVVLVGAGIFIGVKILG
jgi:hypothetical protein